MRRRVDDNYEMLNKNMIYIIDEKLNERGVK